MITDVNMLEANYALAQQVRARAGGRPGEGPLTYKDIVEFGACPRRWRLGAAGAAEDSATWGYVLDAVSLGQAAALRSYSVRPETYNAPGLECPSCKSVGTAKVCARCGVVRRKVDLVHKWSGSATFCKGWAERRARRAT